MNKNYVTYGIIEGLLEAYVGLHMKYDWESDTLNTEARYRIVQLFRMLPQAFIVRCMTMTEREKVESYIDVKVLIYCAKLCES